MCQFWATLYMTAINLHAICVAVLTVRLIRVTARITQQNLVT